MYCMIYVMSDIKKIENIIKSEPILRIIHFKGKTKNSTILIGESINNILKYTEKKKIFIITDINVNRIYKNYFPSGYVFVIGIGEKIKNYETVNSIYNELLINGFDKTSFILGIGGGIVCDIAGFVASTYMRGVKFGLVPTTLLAQVDASIGGKNGINFREYKNMVGIFNQPDFILTDFNTLKTLKADEFKNGIAEIIKHALIGDFRLIDVLINYHEKIINKDISILEKIISRSVEIKLEIVKKDEIETEERKKLNFGHTVGHAIELCEGISHGGSVAIGMAIASGISLKYGFIENDLYSKIIKLLKLYKLPLNTKISVSKLIEKIGKDKKMNNGKIDFILIKSLGDVFIHEMSLKELEVLLNDLCQP